MTHPVSKGAAPSFASASDLHLPPLRPDASTPLWLQLKHALKDFVTFRLQPEDRIPSEAELGEIYGLSRITVRQAITALVDEGLLHRQQGRGTFVRAQRRAEPLGVADHFLTSGFDGADQASIRLYSAETVRAPEWLAEKLGIAAGEEVHKIRKILAPEGTTTAFRTSFVPRRLAPGLIEADVAPPLHAIFEGHYGLKPARAEETVEFFVADAFRAEMLGVTEGHPLILVERVVLLDTGEAIECSRAYYRADKFKLRRRLRRPG